MKFRVEVEERIIVTRERWFEAESAGLARAMASPLLSTAAVQGWPEWTEVCTETEASVVYVEPTVE